MEGNLDIDDLLDQINSSKSTNKTKTKGKKKEETKPTISTAQIVQTFDNIKIENNKEGGTNFETLIDPNAGTSIVLELNGESLDTEVKKKKKKKKKKINKEQAETEEDKEIEEKENKYKQYFDFSKETITNSRYQDNSMFLVLNNWEDKPWGQTYLYLSNRRNFPTISIEEQYPKGDFPIGQIVEYGPSYY